VEWTVNFKGAEVEKIEEKSRELICKITPNTQEILQAGLE